jgi:DNA repair ATPase RecN
MSDNSWEDASAKRAYLIKQGIDISEDIFIDRERVINDIKKSIAIINESPSTKKAIGNFKPSIVRNISRKSNQEPSR